MITTAIFEQEKQGRDFIWVRIFRGGGCQHHQGGMLFRIRGKMGIVKPNNRHRGVVAIPLSAMTLWHSRNKMPPPPRSDKEAA